MKEIAKTIGKALALVAVGALSGVVATLGRRNKSQHMVVSVWAKKPGESSILTQTLVQKKDGRWIHEGDGITVHEVLPGESIKLGE